MIVFNKLWDLMERKNISTYKLREKCGIDSKTIKRLKFNENMESLAGKVGGRDLASFLITPVQRLPRYILFLRELVKNTPKYHPDFQLLEVAYQEIDNVTRDIESASSIAEKQLELYRIHISLASREVSILEASRVLEKHYFVKVLTETNGDEEKAIELLRERGIAKAAKKSDRIAAEGLVETYISEDGKVGVVVEVNAETDFVAKNEEFRNFVADVAKQIAKENPADVEALLEQKSIAEPDKTVREVLTNKIATIGENMSIRRFVRFETNNLLESYIHGDGKIAVLVEMENGTPELAKDVCMQIAAARPEFLDRASVPADRLAKEMEILKAQAMNEGKPAEIAEKVVQGRINKFYSEVCLVEQEFVKDSDIKVGKLVESKGAKIVRFARFEKGEGLEKKQENFAEEVAKQMNG